MSIKADFTSNISVRQTKYAGASENRLSASAGKADGYKRTLEGDSQVNVLHTVRVAIAASGSHSMDLVGTLKDLFGDAAAFATVSGILIMNHSDDPEPINGTAPAATDADCHIDGNFITSRYGASTAIPLPAGCRFEHGPMSLAVTDTSADTITITNESSTVAAYVDVIITGKSS